MELKRKQIPMTVVAGPAEGCMTAEQVKEACGRLGLKYAEGDAERVISYVGTSEAVDRMGEVIKLDGWDLGHFLKNPVVLWSHKMDEPPIGSVLRVTRTEKSLAFDVLYARSEDYAFAGTIERLARAGHIRAVSVGFAPSRWHKVEDPAEMEKLGMAQPGICYDEQELWELSNCSVPANPEALRLSLDAKSADKAFDFSAARDLLTTPCSVAGFPVVEMDEPMRLKLAAFYEPMLRLSAAGSTFAGLVLRAWLLSAGVGNGSSAEVLAIRDGLPEFKLALDSAKRDGLLAAVEQKVAALEQRIGALLEKSPEVKAGAVLSKKNFDRISQAVASLNEVLADADRNSDGEPDETPQESAAVEPVPTVEDEDYFRAIDASTLRGLFP